MTAVAITAMKISRAVPGTIHRQEQARSFSCFNVNGRPDRGPENRREGRPGCGRRVSPVFVEGDDLYTHRPVSRES